MLDRILESGPCNETAKVCRQPSIVESLDQELAKATEYVEKVKRLQDLFNKNPDLKEAVSLMVELRLGRY